MTDSRDRLRGLAAQFTTRQQPAERPESRQQPAQARQQPAERPESRQQPAQARQQPAERPESRQQPAQARQQPAERPESRQQPGERPESRQQPAQARQETPESPQQRARSAPAGERAAKIKTSLNVPEFLAAQLRAWRDDTGRSHGDAIVSALIEHLDDIRTLIDSAAERIELGLAPVAEPVDGKRVLVTFWATEAAIERLDDAAGSLAMTRSALIVRLLDLYLPPLRLGRPQR